MYIYNENKVEYPEPAESDVTGKFFFVVVVVAGNLCVVNHLTALVKDFTSSCPKVFNLLLKEAVDAIDTM